jgi:hypothetical protein
LAHQHAHSSAPQDRPHPTSADEVWRLIAPWLGYVFLGAAAILGLFTASAASDSPTYDSGLATFAVAGILIVMRMKRQLDGRETGFLLPVTASSGDALVVTIALLAVLGIVGGVLAATVGGSIYAIGLALFVISAALIFFEIKRYFDRRDHEH